MAGNVMEWSLLGLASPPCESTKAPASTSEKSNLQDARE